MSSMKLLLAAAAAMVFALASPASAVLLTTPKAGVVDTLGTVVPRPAGFDMIFSHKDAAAGGKVSVVGRRFDAAGRPTGKDLVFATKADAIYHPRILPLSDTSVVAFWIAPATGINARVGDFATAKLQATRTNLTGAGAPAEQNFEIARLKGGNYHLLAYGPGAEDGTRSLKLYVLDNALNLVASPVVLSTTNTTVVSDVTDYKILSMTLSDRSVILYNSRTPNGPNHNSGTLNMAMGSGVGVIGASIRLFSEMVAVDAPKDGVYLEVSCAIHDNDLISMSYTRGYISLSQNYFESNLGYYMFDPDNLKGRSSSRQISHVDAYDQFSPGIWLMNDRTAVVSWNHFDGGPIQFRTFQNSIPLPAPGPTRVLRGEALTPENLRIAIAPLPAGMMAVIYNRGSDAGKSIVGRIIKR